MSEQDAGTYLDFEEPEPLAETPVEPEPEAPVEPETQEPDPEPESEEPLPEAAETPEQVEERKKKTGSQRKKEQLDRERLEKERLSIEVQLLKEQLAARTQPQQEAPKPVAPVDNGPTLDQFETHAEWVTARIRYEAGEMLAQEKARTAWEAKVNEGNGKFEDFEKALQSAPVPSPLVAKRLGKAPVEVLYHLATHPTEYASLNRMRDSDDVADALAELRFRLKSPAAPVAPKTQTKAPAPMTPTKASAVAIQEADGFNAY